MKFLTNLYDPKRWGAKNRVACIAHETPAQAWAGQERWLADKVIGAPMATDTCTVAELSRMGMVGVYSES